MTRTARWHGRRPLARNAKVYVAGSNADDLGNQTGGWTPSWQGSSGPGDAGTTILTGMRQVGPNATITYSKDVSATSAATRPARTQRATTTRGSLGGWISSTWW